MLRSRLRLLATTLGASLALLAAPAFAGTTVVGDPTDDALAITEAGLFWGEFDIDLTSVRIDHGTRDLQVVSTFTYTNADSWNVLRVLVDSTLDGVADYTVVWGRDEGVTGVLDAADNVVCDSVPTAERLGVNGSLTVTVPRSCLGNPASLAVHVDVMWAGYNTSGNELYFLDSAPGDFVDEPPLFSSAVASSNTGTVTSPKPPAPAPAPAKTRVVLKLSKKAQVVGKAPASLRINVTGNPAGRLEIADGRKVLKRVTVRAGKGASYKLPRKLKPGTHRLKVSFVPSDTVRFSPSTATIRLRVRR